MMTKNSIASWYIKFAIIGATFGLFSAGVLVMAQQNDGLHAFGKEWYMNITFIVIPFVLCVLAFLAVILITPTGGQGMVGRGMVHLFNSYFDSGDREQWTVLSVSVGLAFMAVGLYIWIRVMVVTIMIMRGIKPTWVSVDVIVCILLIKGGDGSLSNDKKNGGKLMMGKRELLLNAENSRLNDIPNINQQQQEERPYVAIV